MKGGIISWERFTGERWKKICIHSSILYTLTTLFFFFLNMKVLALGAVALLLLTSCGTSKDSTSSGATDTGAVETQTSTTTVVDTTTGTTDTTDTTTL